MKWEEVCCHQSIDYEEEIDEWLVVHHFKDKNIIILWGYVEQPALRTSLEHALNVINDVTAVRSDTFMFSESGYVIEFFPDKLAIKFVAQLQMDIRIGCTCSGYYP
ncbi:CDI toxin immunity protein [Bacillus atrophaeus]